jgi:hypothetical protein
MSMVEAWEDHFPLWLEESQFMAYDGYMDSVLNLITIMEDI